MSEMQLKAFLDAVKSDANLQEKLKTAADPQAVVLIAKAAGFSISVDCISNNQASVSDDELEAAAGGTLCIMPGMPSTFGRPGAICLGISLGGG